MNNNLWQHTLASYYINIVVQGSEEIKMAGTGKTILVTGGAGLVEN